MADEAQSAPPERIWLQWEEYESAEYGVTWTIEQIHETDVGYIALSHIEKKDEQISELQRENERLRERVKQAGSGGLAAHLAHLEQLQDDTDWDLVSKEVEENLARPGKEAAARIRRFMAALADQQETGE